MLKDLVPSEFRLMQNYPNPFTRRTAIKYCVPQKCRVTITIRDSHDQDLELLVDEEKVPGTYEVIWDAGDVPCGIYWCRMQADSFAKKKKMLLTSPNQ